MNDGACRTDPVAGHELRVSWAPSVGDRWLRMIAVIAMVLISGTFIGAQAIPEFLWAVGAGGAEEDRASGIGVDSSGNSYVCWGLKGSVDLGGVSYTSAGESDVLVAKLDSAGNYVWIRQVGGRWSDSPSAMVTDSDGNSYLTGRFAASVSFGTRTITGVGTGDIFVAKLDTSGNWLWAISGNGATAGYPSGISIDSSGNSWVIGTFSGTTTFNGAKLYSNGGLDVFVARLSANGDWSQTRGYGGSKHDYGCGIAADGGGNCIVTGYFNDSILIGTEWLTSAGMTDAFVAKLDVGGACVWAKTASGADEQRAYAIACDGSGNSYMAGYFHGATHFGAMDLACAGSSDVFVAKLDAVGNWEWARQAGGSSSDQASAICTDGSGKIYVSGSFCGLASFGSYTVADSDPYNADVFVAKLDAAGNWLWALSGGGPDDEDAVAIAANAAGNSYVAGYFPATATLGFTNLQSRGNADVLMAKISNAPVPAVPQQLTISRSGSDVLLQWQPVTRTSRGETIQGSVHYEVYRSDLSPSGPYPHLSQTNATSHTHTGALAQPRGFYRVKAVIGGN